MGIVSGQELVQKFGNFQTVCFNS